MELEKYRSNIDKNATIMETMGLTPVSSRIFIYLMYAGEKDVSFEELVDYFKVSKSAVSNAINLLLTVEMISFKTYGGQRKRFFYCNMEAMLSQRAITQRINKFLTVIENIRRCRGKKGTFDEELQHIALFYKMTLAELPIILQRWRNSIELESKS